MLTIIIGFLYWLGGEGGLRLWHTSPVVAFVMVCVFIAEGIAELVSL